MPHRAVYGPIMLMTPNHLRRIWGLQPKRVLHVGAHLAEEAEMYSEADWGQEVVVWVEADPEVCSTLIERTRGFHNHFVLNALAWSESGREVAFNRANNGESSSVFEFADHTKEYPHISMTDSVSLATLALQDAPLVQRTAPFDFINLDVQGAELAALQGMSQLLPRAQWVYTEVSFRELYRGAPQFEEMRDFLTKIGFQLVDLARTRRGWGDSLWLNGEAPTWTRIRRNRRRLLSASDRARKLPRTIAGRSSSRLIRRRAGS